jgi:endonuclease YncB( thermonuclease family)
MLLPRFVAVALVAMALPSLAADITGPVTHIRDGDTIVVARKPVPICGIDTAGRCRRDARLRRKA